jgi:hypothetical protein
MTPRYDESTRFLQLLYPEGPWTLTSIEPDRKGITTQTFRLIEEVLPWLDEHGASRNIYYALNPLLGPVNKKAERENVMALAWLHVDLDPRAGEDIAAEQARCLALLQNPPAGVLPPTGINFSGGGYNGIWKLRDPFGIRGDLALAEEAKLWNLQLEILLGADACHNVDRILRLPGTLNRPGSRKRKKGRKIALAELVEWHEDRVYDLSQFTKAPQVQDPGARGGAAPIEISGDVERLQSVDDLGDDVPDWCKVLIVQGEDPTNPTRHQSRSEALWAVCCELARRGVDDRTIYSIITDPDFGISASVLELGARAEAYAVRQIGRAREEAEDPNLREMNDKYAVIGDFGGRCVVIAETYDHALDRTRMSRQAFADFEKRFMNQRIQIGTKKDGVTPVYEQLGKWWLRHERRRQYDAITFAPARDLENVYNLWRGFACEARPGDCSLYLDHVRDNVCRGNEDHYRYLMGWFATAVQKPAQPGRVAIVLRGTRGTGKSFFARTFGSLWGRHFMQVADPKFLVGSFNQHLRDCVVLFGDEAFYAGDRKHESVLKTLITEELLTVEAKYADAETAANYVHLIMASNEDWVVPAGFRERRFLVLDVGDEHAKDNQYFAAIQNQMDGGGREALLHLLLSWDLSEFDVRDVPATRALAEQQVHSMTGLYAWWRSKLYDGAVLDTDDDWERKVPCSTLGYDLRSHMQGFSRDKFTLNRLDLFLKKVLPGGLSRRRLREPMEVRGLDGTLVVSSRPRAYILPSLEDCRAHWNAHIEADVEWPETDREEDADAEDGNDLG